jgi:hypothetical protein
MWYPRLSQRVNKPVIFLFLQTPPLVMFSDSILNASNSYRVPIFDHSHRVVYATLGFTWGVA